MPISVAYSTLKISCSGAARLSPDLTDNSVYVLGRDGKIFFSNIAKEMYSLRKHTFSSPASRSSYVSIRREILKAGFSLAEAVGEYKAYRLSKTEFYIQLRRIKGNAKAKESLKRGRESRRKESSEASKEGHKVAVG